MSYRNTNNIDFVQMFLERLIQMVQLFN